MTLTAAGLELWGKSFAFRLEYLRSIFRGWDTGDIRTFQALLTRFAAAVHDNPPSPPPPLVVRGDSR